MLYVSLHRYDYACFFPGSREANYDHIGQGEGKGFNMNVAWNDVSEYMCKCVSIDGSGR